MSDFGIFWAVYPRKVAKKDAARAWNKLTPEQRVAAMDALPKHVASWDDPMFIPYPASWLHGERWEDVLEDLRPEKKSEWWTTQRGIEERGRELKVFAKPGESYFDFKRRVQQADETDKMLRTAI